MMRVGIARYGYRELTTMAPWPGALTPGALLAPQIATSEEVPEVVRPSKKFDSGRKEGKMMVGSGVPQGEDGG